MLLLRTLLVSAILLSPSTIASQSTPQGDSRALGLMQNLTTALGGPLLLGIQDTVAIADVASLNADGTTTVRRVTLKTLGRHGVRIEAETPEGLSVVTMDARRTRARAAGRNDENYTRRLFGAINVPHLPLLSVLADVSNSQNTKVEYLGLEKSGDGELHHVRIHAALNPEDGLGEFDAPIDVFIDPQTALPARIVYFRRAQDNLRVTIPVELKFSDFRHFGGLVVPFRISYSIRKTLLAEYTLLSFAVNQGAQPSDFEVR